MDKYFSKLKEPAHFVLAFVVLAFMIKAVALIRLYGTEAKLDQVAEHCTVGAARHYLDVGLMENAGLPLFKDFVVETPIAKIRDTRIYTHFLQGPEYVFAGILAIFGDSKTTLQWARLFPWLQLVAAVLFFVFFANGRIWNRSSWGRTWAAFLIFFAPAIYIWGLSYHGQSYSSTYVLLALTLGLAGAELPRGKKGNRKRHLYWGWAFLLGFLSNWMLLTNAATVFAAPFVGFLLHQKRGKWVDGFWLSFWVGCGLLASFGVHFIQVASFLGDWGLAAQDQFGTASARSGRREGPDWVTLIGQYSDHVRAFFRMNALHLLFTGLFVAWLSRDPVRGRLRMAALGISVIACYAWVLLFQHHSYVHYFLNPKTFLLLYVVWVAVFVAVGVEKMSKSKKVK